MLSRIFRVRRNRSARVAPSKSRGGVAPSKSKAGAVPSRSTRVRVAPSKASVRVIGANSKPSTVTSTASSSISIEDNSSENFSIATESNLEFPDVFHLPPSHSKYFLRNLRHKEQFQQKFTGMSLNILQCLDTQIQGMIEKLIPAIKAFATPMFRDEERILRPELSVPDSFICIIAQIMENIDVPATNAERKFYREYGIAVNNLQKRIHGLKHVNQMYQDELTTHFLGIKPAFKSLIQKNMENYKSAKMLLKADRENFAPTPDEAANEGIQVFGQLKMKRKQGTVKLRGSVTECAGGDFWVSVDSLPLKTQHDLLESVLQEIKSRIAVMESAIGRNLYGIKLDTSSSTVWKSSQFQLDINKLLASCQYQNVLLKPKNTINVLFHWMKVINKFDRLFHLLKVTKDAAKLLKKDLVILEKGVKNFENGSLRRMDLDKNGNERVMVLPLYTNWPKSLEFVKCS